MRLRSGREISGFVADFLRLIDVNIGGFRQKKRAKVFYTQNYQGRYDKTCAPSPNTDLRLTNLRPWKCLIAEVSPKVFPPS